MAISYKITAVESRRKMAENLQKQLGIPDEDVIWDDRPGGGNPFYTFEKAWTSPVPDGCTHRIVFNEDVHLCENFKEIAEQAIAAHPDSVISFFNTELNGYDDELLEKAGTPYFRWPGFYGMAICMPVNYIKDCFTFISLIYDKETVHDSYAVGDYLRQKGIEILITNPVPVQHLGDDSLYLPGSPIRRSTRFSEHPEADWSCKKTAVPPAPDWFKPRHTI